MAPIISDVVVHMRTDRSVTQMMLENPCNADPSNIVCEDTLTSKTATYGSIRADAFAAAHALRHQHGLAAGDTVTIIGRSQVDYILAAHAVWAAGCVVSTVNHSSAPKEIVHALKIVKPRLLIVDVAVLDKVRRAFEGLDVSPAVMTLVERVPDTPLFPDDLLSNERIDASAYVLDGRDARTVCAAVVLSSGTTGLPKAVMLSHHNLVCISEMLRAHNPDNWRGSQREVFFPPLSHIYGLYVCALMAPWLGSYVCMVPSFDVETYCRLMHEKRATLARLVPPVALALAQSPVVQKYSYPDLEYFSCSAAPLTPVVANQLRRQFPGVSLCQTYGCTELASCVAQSGVRDRHKAPLIAAGSLLANMHVRFVNEQGQDVMPPVPGEICVSSPTIMMGYKDDPAATAATMLEPGWFRTGDVGYLNANGYLVIVDRLKDVIKYKGFQVSPSELEEVLFQHSGIQDVGVTSVWDDAQATELPCAFVVPRTGKGTDDLASNIKNMVASKVAGYKKLTGGVYFVDELPRNPTGKLLRRELRKIAQTRARL
ncbi:hypothetical protein SEUCBS140593_007764 [Sporothrix eucalyptigena]|uniref:Uncharacterized protein n=1 Tax=Sporothrix eucalyptigena TaxID=1812306 RepID=A0ABP0CFX5_9PEZI